MDKGKKFIIGYIGDTGLESITKEEALKHTHFNIAFGVVEDGSVVVHLKHMDGIKKIREYNPSIKIILSIGGWGAGGFSEAASTDEGRKLFAKTSVDAVRKYDLDGVDIDWEYPCLPWAGIAASPDDKVNYTLLLKELREQLDSEEKQTKKYYMLTVAVGAGDFFTKSTEMDKVQTYLDYVQLMTYDMNGNPHGVTTHHTNLYCVDNEFIRRSGNKAVNQFVEAGVPIEKLIMGVAFYSRKWEQVPDINHGLFQKSAVKGGGYGPDFSDIKENYINKNGFVRYWDDTAKAPYLYNGNEFITYDDEESVAYKCQYVKDNGLAGAMYWVFECDKTGILADVMVKELN